MKHARPTTANSATIFQGRHTIADWAFYDVSGLNAVEFAWLSEQRVQEGSVLVVLPSDGADTLRLCKHRDHDALCTAPGEPLRHFAVAGVGSSDIGAAALARTLANHLQEPVGAIVAGHGMADVLQEALGGWFFFGPANRAQAALGRFSTWLSRPLRGKLSGVERARASVAARGSNDTRTLLRLMQDEDREIRTLLGHSKGCLSIAFAFNLLRNLQGRDALSPFRDTRVVMCGAAVALPKQLQNVEQYLGAIDWFGGLNSTPGVGFIPVPYAWHHLNTEIPLHMDLRRVLEGHYDPVRR